MDANMLRTRLLAMRKKLGLTTRIPCTEEENARYLAMVKNLEPLPDGVQQDFDPNGMEKFDTFTKEAPSDITEAELQEYLTLHNASNLNIIKNCVVFFTVLTAVSILITLIWILAVFA